MKYIILFVALIVSSCGISERERVKLVVDTATKSCIEGTELITLSTDGIFSVTCKPKQKEDI